MGGDQPAPRFVVPDYKIYGQKMNELPLIVEHQRKLEKLGLKDPWIRNEVWRFMPENDIQGLWPKAKATVFKNCGKAFLAAAITYGLLEYVLPKPTQCPGRYGLVNDHPGH